MAVLAAVLLCDQEGAGALLTSDPFHTPLPSRPSREPELGHRALSGRQEEWRDGTEALTVLCGP